jgi:hypothetical protein
MSTKNKLTVKDELTEFLLFTSPDGKVKVEIFFHNENIWLTQKRMAELFGVQRPAITKHLNNIIKEGELEENSVSSILEHTAEDGKAYRTKYYNLDAIISVGYRVNSSQATKFRIWATERLKEYMIKGFVLDDERLKNPDIPFDYFNELLRRIQDIRTSEKRFYQKITEIYATSVDYDPTSEISITFFKTVQNKLHWAITGQTAAEIINDRADVNLPNMGLTNFRGTKPRKQDVTIAKNYLNEEELSALNNLVEQYLVFAEGQAMRRIPMNMQNWVKKLDGFLGLNDREILTHAGKISHALAKQIAELTYDKFNQMRIEQSDKLDGDFERAIKKIPAHKD